MKANFSAQHKFDDVTIEEHRTEFVLKQTKTHQTTNVSEGVESLGSSLALNWRIKAALSRTEKRKIMLGFLMSNTLKISETLRKFRKVDMAEPKIFKR